MERQLDRMSLNERMSRAERHIRHLEAINIAMMEELASRGKRIIVKGGKVKIHSFEPVEIEEMPNAE